MVTMLVVGYGPGISRAVTERFAREGYDLALVARDVGRVEAAAADLRAAGTSAMAIPADASDPEAVRRAVRAARAELGPIGAVLWTAFGGGGVRDVLATDPDEGSRVFDIGVRGLLACARECRDDLAAAGGAILVANGALGEPSAEADRYSAALGSDGVALENAAKSKLVGLLAARLRDEGIYVGEVTIAGSVAGTATEGPGAIAPERIAERFWAMSRDRDATRVRVTPAA